MQICCGSYRSIKKFLYKLLTTTPGELISPGVNRFAVMGLGAF
jgi:hypothetical protein